MDFWHQLDKSTNLTKASVWLSDITWYSVCDIKIEKTKQVMEIALKTGMQESEGIPDIHCSD